MSKNSKNSKRIVAARAISAQRQAGNPGSSKTQAVHGKKWTYRTNPEIAKRITEAVKEASAKREKNQVRLGKAADDFTEATAELA